MEVYGVNGYAITVASDHLRVRYRGEETESQMTAAPLPDDQATSLNYLFSVLRGKVEATGDLSALDTNVVVMQILDAARQSAKTGRTIEIQPLSQ